MSPVAESQLGSAPEYQSLSKGVQAFAAHEVPADFETAPPSPDEQRDATPDSVIPELEGLAQRDRLLAESQQLMEEGHPDTAADRARAALAIQQELSAPSVETIAILDTLAACEESMESWDSARRTREQIIEVTTAVYGVDNFRVADARFAVESVTILESLTAEQRVELAEAIAKNRDVEQLMRDGRYQEAVLLARAHDFASLLGGDSRHPEYAIGLRNEALASVAADYIGMIQVEGQYHHALGIQRATLGEFHPAVAETMSNLAAFYLMEGDAMRAAPFIWKAMEIRESTLGNRHPDYGLSLCDVGQLLIHQAEYGRAEPLLRQAALIAESCNDPSHQVRIGSVSTLAAWHHAQADYLHAEPLYRKGVEVARTVNGDLHPEYAVSLSKLADFLVQRGEFAEARALLLQAREIQEKTLDEQHSVYADTLMLLALANAGLGKARESLPLAHKAVRIWSDEFQYGSAGRSERQKLAKKQRFSAHLDTLLSLAHIAEGPAEDIYIDCLAVKGLAYRQQRKLRWMHRAVEIVPNGGMAEDLATYRTHVRQLDRISKLIPHADDAESHRIRVEELTILVEYWEKRIAIYSSFFGQTRDPPPPAPLDLAGKLPAGAALIDICEFSQFIPDDDDHTAPRWESQYVAFILRADALPAVVWLGPAAPIDAAIQTWRRQFGTGLSTEAGAELRRSVWELFESWVGEASTVLISPEGEFTALPWGALPGSTDGTYLIEERSFVVIPVPSQLPELIDRSAQPDSSPSLLVVGDVDYGADPGHLEPGGSDRAAAAERDGNGLDRFVPLENTRLEAAAVQDAFEAAYSDGTTIWLRGDAATEQQFREVAPQSAYLHLATHGYFAPETLRSVLTSTGTDRSALSLFGYADVGSWQPGLLSGVVLSGANYVPDPDRDDGILSAMEVAQLDLTRVQLATLSACETGLGQSAGSEGALGLQRSLHLAGARTAVTSLWKVDDLATRRLMERFYANLWEHQMSCSAALREAQLWMLSDGTETVRQSAAARGSTPADSKLDDSGRVPPYYWAGFVLSGDWR